MAELLIIPVLFGVAIAISFGCEHTHRAEVRVKRATAEVMQTRNDDVGYKERWETWQYVQLDKQWRFIRMPFLLRILFSPPPLDPMPQ